MVKIKWHASLYEHDGSVTEGVVELNEGDLQLTEEAIDDIVLAEITDYLEWGWEFADAGEAI